MGGLPIPRVFDACFAKKLFARPDKDGVGFWHGQVCSSARLSNGPSASMSSDSGIGLEERALQLLASTQGGNVLNTSFIERINGTFRERLASLTRRCRHASHSVEMLAAGMWLVGCTYNFCWPHHELSRQRKQNLTPAMASGLTDHPWSVRELLAHRIAPPPWNPPKRRGQPPKSGCPRQTPPVKRQTGLLRLRKGGLCPSTR